MFISIRFSFLLTLICMHVNLELVLSMKFWNTETKTKFISIDDTYLKEYDYMPDNEAEISLLTKSLGFIVCDQNQESFMGNFTRQYISMKEGHVVRPYRIKTKRFNQSSFPVEDKKKQCQNYLNDAVLRQNQIYFLAEDEYLLQEIKAVEMEVVFGYYSKEPEMVTAIQCPVIVREEQQMLYIAGVSKGDNFKGDQYFVMSQRSTEESTKLSILMRTITESNTKRNDLETQEKPQLINNEDRFTNRLIVHDYWNNDNFRLFGKDAERAYITMRYGFINLIYNQNIVDQFIELVESLRKVYKIKGTLTESIIKEWSPERRLQLCNEYIRSSSGIKVLPVALHLVEDGLDNQIEVINEKIKYKYEKRPDETHKFLKCPINYRIDHDEQKITLYIMPIVFEDKNRCGLSSFIKIPVPSDDKRENQEVLFYSKHVVFKNAKKILSHRIQDNEKDAINQEANGEDIVDLEDRNQLAGPGTDEYGPLTYSHS